MAVSRCWRVVDVVSQVEETDMTDLPKHVLATNLLELGTLFVHLDPRHRALDDGLQVPPWLRYQEQLVLQFGYNMQIPITDLKVDDSGISGTLSFSRTPHKCYIPWTRVFAMVGDEGEGRVWKDAMPAVIRKLVDAEEARPRLEESQLIVKRPVRSGLRAVDNCGTSVRRRPAKRGHLRVVK